MIRFLLIPFSLFLMGCETPIAMPQPLDIKFDHDLDQKRCEKLCSDQGGLNSIDYIPGKNKHSTYCVCSNKAMILLNLRRW